MIMVISKRSKIASENFGLEQHGNDLHIDTDSRQHTEGCHQSEVGAL